MEKILKFLRKLNSKELSVVESAIIAVKNNKLDDYNVKKLTGFTNIYRVKIKSIRIIFKNDNGLILILDVGRRNESTYKDY